MVRDCPQFLFLCSFSTQLFLYVSDNKVEWVQSHVAGFPKRLRKELSIISNQASSVMEMAGDEGDLDMEPERITQ